MTASHASRITCSMMFLLLDSIEKSFAGKPVLRAVSLALATGEILVLLGPSGCGKTTLLRVIAGLTPPDDGRIHLDGQDLARRPVHERGFGFVFQDYALFPHKNVFQNVAFGLRMLKWEPSRLRDRVNQVLDLVGLADFGTRPIHELSGGEQQRVALARSLAPAPRLILLDEPLGALDRALREHLMLELRSILKQAGDLLGRPEGITAIYVTHDQTEAFAIADRVAVMNDGRIEQQDSPTKLYRWPATPFVARFLGMENLFTGRVVSLNPYVVQTGLGALTVRGSRQRPSEPITILVRPEAGRLLAGESNGNETVKNQVNGRLQSLSFRGRYQIATITDLQSPTPNPQSPILNLQSPKTLKLEFDSAVSLPAVGSRLSLSLESGAIVPLEGS